MIRNPFGALLLLVCVTACAPEVPHLEPGPTPVKVIEVSAEDLAPTRTVTFLGTIATEQTASLAFEVGGRVMEIFVEEGSFIEKGTLLARLDEADLLSMLGAARTDFETAEENYNRTRDLAEQGAESQARVDVAKLRLETARSRLATSNNRLDHARLVAPSDGYIGRRLVEVSDSVVARQPVMILQDASARRMRAIIPESDITLSRYLMPLKDGIVDAQPRLERGHRIAATNPRVVANIYPDREFPCEFVALTTAAHPVTRTLTMTMRFATPDDIPVFAGTSAKLLLDIPSELEGLVSIPAVAVSAAAGDASFVWSINASGMVSAKPVSIERINGDRAQVSGLSVGDRIVASGVTYLRDGDLVTTFER